MAAHAVLVDALPQRIVDRTDAPWVKVVSEGHDKLSILGTSRCRHLLHHICGAVQTLLTRMHQWIHPRRRGRGTLFPYNSKTRTAGSKETSGVDSLVSTASWKESNLTIGRLSSNTPVAKRNKGEGRHILLESSPGAGGALPSPEVEVILVPGTRNASG